MTPEQKAIDRMFPDPPDPTVAIQQHLYDCRAKLADAEAAYRELLDAVGRCEADIHAPDDAARQLAALEQKRTDLLAAGYIKRLVSNTGKLDAEITSAAQQLADLRTRAGGAAQARAQLMAQLVTARSVVEDLQRAVSTTSRQLTGRAPTAEETAEYERDVLAQMQRRRQEADPAAAQQRKEEQQREERVRAEKARQLRQKADRHTGPSA
jgi:hypothetical protein